LETNSEASYILNRLRRLRKSESIRSLVEEVNLSLNNLMIPVFVQDGIEKPQPIESMPGIFRYPLHQINSYVGRLRAYGIRSFLIFGIPEHKDELGTGAYSENNIIVRAIDVIKKEYSEVTLAADVCLCEYTEHGHCGIIENGEVDNDATLPLLSKAAVSYAQAGADIVAPSAMMDFQVRSIRYALEDAGLKNTLIMAYSAKFASSFYGPFREAAKSKPAFGDRSGYQLDFCNAKQAMREIQQDIKEGADIIMVKPALAYLDIISRASRRFVLPIAAYNVSGEYSMIKAASLNGWIDEQKAVFETVTAIRRAGADVIITYFAEQIAKWSKGEL
jgi:porphobilinogen synthase